MIEVLAAVAVLALTLGAILSGAAFYGRNGVYLQDRMLAGWVAHNAMVDVQVQPEWPALGRSNGHTELAGREWYWEREVQKTPDPALRRVTIQVRPDAQDEGWLVSVSGFFAQPAAAASGGIR